MSRLYLGGLLSTASIGTPYSGIWTAQQQFIQIGQGNWPGSSAIAFTNATFTPGTQVGQTGPDLATARTGLTGTGTDTWKTNTAYFNTSNGIQLWTVPVSGTYRFDVAGASGGWDTSRNQTCSRIGLGGRYQFDIVLTQGSQIQIVVGQRGGSVSSSNYLGGGGGGGTFVFTGSRGAGGLIVAAGGGGGAGSSGSYNPANGGGPAAGVNGNFAGTSGSAGLCDASYDGNPGAGGTFGAGGQSGASGWSEENTGGGTGWVSDGQPNPDISQVSAVRGTGFTGGGLTSSAAGAEGGFGGGGATSYNSSFAGGGGGGGYSGGGGGGWNANAGGCISNSSGSGGGGGGFVIATAINPTSTSGFREGHGYVSVTKL